MGIKVLSGEKGKTRQRKPRPVEFDTSLVVAHLRERNNRFFAGPEQEQEQEDMKQKKKDKRIIPAWLGSE